MPGSNPVHNDSLLLLLLLELCVGLRPWLGAIFWPRLSALLCPWRGSLQCLGSGRHVQECDRPLGAPAVATLGKEGWSLTQPMLAPVCKCPAWHSSMFTAPEGRALGSGLVLPLKLCMSPLFQSLSRLQLACHLPWSCFSHLELSSEWMLVCWLLPAHG